MRRTPVQTLLVALAVAGGAVVGARLVGEHVARRAPPRPDIDVVGADLAALERAGYRFDHGRPRTWQDIDLRQVGDERGDLLVLRARMAADEAAALVRFPADARRPAEDAPPADWPRGGDGDRLRLPAWFAPQGAQTLFYEKPLAGGWQAAFAAYDPATGVFQLWAWRRADTRLERPAPRFAIADEIASALGDRLLRASDRDEPWTSERGQVRRRPWLTGRDIAAADVVAGGRLPAATIDAALVPMRGEHRYLLAIDAIERDAALVVAGAHMPLRPLADDAPPPLDRWEFAAPANGLPAWFAPGPGPRWCYVQLAIGSGEVPSARWVAYDTARRRLFVWDWEEPAPRPATADLTALK